LKEDPWHTKEEEFLKKIEAQCNAYQSYFNKDYQYYHSLSSRFNIPILIVSSINALTAISLNDFLTQRYVSILNAVLSAGTGILGSIQLYMKINEKMSNALRSGILMKRLALKISKEMSIDREQRGTVGQQFLQECFSEFNAALEQSNPIEKKVQNFLALGQQPPAAKPMSFLNLASAAVASISPKRSSMDLETSFTSYGMMSLPGEIRAKTLWGFLGTNRRAESSPLGSESPPNLTESVPEEDSPRGRGAGPRVRGCEV
jgi:hypothetical protein